MRLIRRRPSRVSVDYDIYIRGQAEQLRLIAKAIRENKPELLEWTAGELDLRLAAATA